MISTLRIILIFLCLLLVFILGVTPILSTAFFDGPDRGFLVSALWLPYFVLIGFILLHMPHSYVITLIYTLLAGVGFLLTTGAAGSGPDPMFIYLLTVIPVLGILSLISHLSLFLALKDVK
jgi:hypothetical protein